jgi:proteasome lid subunit RPN8/RPN11
MTSIKLIMSTEIKQQLIQHAKDELPNECCGYVTGFESTLKTVYQMTNVDASPVHFNFDPKEQFQVVKSARLNKEQPIVVYHSHPKSEAVLSDEDLRLLNDPNMVYVIISLEKNEPELKAYQIVDAQVNNIQIIETNKEVL